MASFVMYVCDVEGCGVEVRATRDPPSGWLEVSVRVWSEFNPRCSIGRLLCPTCAARLATIVPVGSWLEGRNR